MDTLDEIPAELIEHFVHYLDLDNFNISRSANLRNKNVSTQSYIQRKEQELDTITALHTLCTQH